MNKVKLSLLLLVAAALPLIIVPCARCLYAPADGAIVVTINLQCIGRAGEGTGSASAPYWEVSPLPSSEDISISPTRDDVRQAILKALDAMRATEASTGKHFRVSLNDRTGLNFAVGLEKSLQEQIEVKLAANVPAVFVKPPGPAQIGKSVSGPYKIKLTIGSVKNLHILIVTEQAAKDGATVISLTKTIQEINQHFDLGNLTPDEQRIPVVIKYTAADELPAGEASRPGANAEAKLTGVAAYAFRQARTGGLVLGKPELAGNLVAGIEDRIKAEYRLANPKVEGWSMPDARIKKEDQNTGLWGIEVSQLRFTRTVTIKVKADGATDKDQQLEKSLNKKYAPRLVNRRGDIPTNDQVIQDKVFLNRIPEITSVAEITSTDSDLIFVVSRRKTLVNLLLSASGGYSTDQSGFGEAKGTLSNFFHIGETLSLQAKAGRKITDCALLFNWYRQEPFKKQRDYTVDAKVGYYHNRKQRFGNLFGPAFNDREPGGEGNFTLGFDSFTIDERIEDAQSTSGKRLRYNLQAKTGFEYRDVRVTARSLGTLIARGQAAVFSLNVDQTLSAKIRKPHLDSLSLQVTASGWKGLSILGGDFPYEQFRITASPQIFFGFQQPTDMFFRYVRGIGASSRDTPIFKLFRFGGAQNVRGLEEGEIVGRNIAFENWETGLSTQAIWNWLHRSSKPEDKKNFGGLDLSSIYLKLFYDRGRVLDESSLRELLDLAHGVRGYGIAVELKGFPINGKRASLTLGFARSPDSKLHPIGVVTSGVSFDF
jgi:hypothetical protein